MKKNEKVNHPKSIKVNKMIKLNDRRFFFINVNVRKDCFPEVKKSFTANIKNFESEEIQINKVKKS